jgi:hypothetical protein
VSQDRNREQAAALELRLSIDSWTPLHGWLGSGADAREFQGWTGLSATLEEIAEGRSQSGDSAWEDSHSL